MKAGIKVLYSTQGLSLDLFYNLNLALKKNMEISNQAYYLSNSRYFRRFLKRYPDFDDDNKHLLKEWEILKNAENVSIDMDLIDSFQSEIGQPTLWNALIVDRRFSLGKNREYQQDYKSLFNHEQKLKLLQQCLEEINSLFREFKPDLIIGLTPATIGEYLLYLFAKARNISTQYLIASKVKNYVYFAEEFLGCPREIEISYKTYSEEENEDEWTLLAEKYLEESRKGNMAYEGASKATPIVRKAKGNKIKKIVNVIYQELLDQFSGTNNGIDSTSIFRGNMNREVIRPFRRIRILNALRKKYIPTDELSGINYVFYPLHSEPELALSIYGVPFQNQIEVIRHLAQSLPVGWKVVVKEHPGTIGYRKISYYKKILEISNVVLADPLVNSRQFIEQAKMTATISGFVGFESIVFGKPVLTYGERPYNILPDNMVNQIKDLWKLPEFIDDLLKDYKYQHKYLKFFIASIMKHSIPANMFENLLKKRGRIAINDDYKKSTQFLNAIDELGIYLSRLIND